MAEQFSPTQVKSKLGWSNSFDRNAAFPLDINSWFGSYEEAVAAAAKAVQVGSSESKYYFGQQVYVFDGSVATTYLIQGDGTLKEIGSGKSLPMIFVDNEAGMLALTDIEIGQQVFREDTSTIWLFKGGVPSSIDSWVETASQNDTVWQGTENKVNFYALARATYDGIAIKDSNTLYFLSDEGKIYKGSTLMNLSFIQVTAMPNISEAITNAMYLDTNTFAMQITFDNRTWLSLSPGYLTDGANWATADSNRFATIGLIKKALTETINGINTTPAFDNATGTISIGDNPDGAVLTGVTHDPTYNSSQLKLTIPVYGGEDIVVDIPKDKFVTAGTYNSETQNIELTIDGQEEKVLIPASDLVDVYTADNTGKNVTIAISDDNKISASIKIDPATANALKYDPEKGFIVDISGKIDKIAGATGDQIVVSNADGSIAESEYTINSTGTLGTSNTEIPTASTVDSAITSAVNTAAEDKIDKVVGEVGNLVAFDANGAIKDSQVKAGGATLAETPDENTLATEAAVADILAWKNLG